MSTAERQEVELSWSAALETLISLTVQGCVERRRFLGKEWSEELWIMCFAVEIFQGLLLAPLSHAHGQRGLTSRNILGYVPLALPTFVYSSASSQSHVEPPQRRVTYVNLSKVEFLDFKLPRQLLSTSNPLDVNLRRNLHLSTWITSLDNGLAFRTG